MHTPATRFWLRSSAACLILAAPAFAGDELSEALVLSGDVIGTMGVANTFGDLDVNDNGDWVIGVSTDTTSLNNSVLMANGQILATEGQVLTALPGVFLNVIGDVGIDDAGEVYYDAGLSGAPLNALLNATSDTSLIQEGDSFIGLGLPDGYALAEVSRFQLFGTNDFIADALFEEVANPGVFADGIVRFTDDGVVGGLAATGVVFEGDLVAGGSGTLETISSGNHSLATNSAGLALFVAGTTPDEFTPVTYSIALENTVVVTEGSPSPLPGRDWSDLAVASVAINDSNDVAWEGRITGDSSDNYLLVKNGEKVAQRGDAVPGLPGPTLLDFNNLPLYLSDSGELLWCGVWIGGGLDFGLFIDDKPLVLTGVTQVDGATVVELDPYFTGYAMSDNGRYVIFGADLSDGRSGVFRIDRWGNAEPIASCNGNLASLTAPNGGPQIGETLTLRFETAETPSAIAFLGLAPAVLSPCGLDLPGIGEVLIDFGLGLTLLPAGTLSGGPLDAAFPIPADASLFGAQTFAQGLLGDLSGGASQATFLTDALRLCIGG
jgi:hypothetical protein